MAVAENGNSSAEDEELANDRLPIASVTRKTDLGLQRYAPQGGESANVCVYGGEDLGESRQNM